MIKKKLSYSVWHDTQKHTAQFYLINFIFVSGQCNIIEWLTWQLHQLNRGQPYNIEVLYYWNLAEKTMSILFLLIHPTSIYWLPLCLCHWSINETIFSKRERWSGTESSGEPRHRYTAVHSVLGRTTQGWGQHSQPEFWRTTQRCYQYLGSTCKGLPTDGLSICDPISQRTICRWEQHPQLGHWMTSQ